MLLVRGEALFVEQPSPHSLWAPWAGLATPVGLLAHQPVHLLGGDVVVAGVAVEQRRQFLPVGSRGFLRLLSVLALRIALARGFPLPLFVLHPGTLPEVIDFLLAELDGLRVAVSRTHAKILVVSIRFDAVDQCHDVLPLWSVSVLLGRSPASLTYLYYSILYKICQE